MGPGIEPVTVTLPGGTVVTCPPELAKKLAGKPPRPKRSESTTPKPE